jgi:hypothetical protein
MAELLLLLYLLQYLLLPLILLDQLLLLQLSLGQVSLLFRIFLQLLLHHPMQLGGLRLVHLVRK